MDQFHKSRPTILEQELQIAQQVANIKLGVKIVLTVVALACAVKYLVS